jgi:hypothetical protein
MMIITVTKQLRCFSKTLLKFKLV